ncbi:MAG: pilus assembly protein [Anaerolineales bacterium]|nr:pilus assembly protein [Anaerolineales bacterium]
MKESKFFWRNRRARGQSIVEFALMAPILLILLSGLFEFGFIFNSYLAVLDSARNAARFSSDNQYDMRDADPDCDISHDGSVTRDFYRQAACEAVGNLAAEQPTITLCLKGVVQRRCDGNTWSQMDDVIISVFSVLRLEPTGAQIVRFPDTGCAESGWSYAADLAGRSQCSERTGLHASQFTSAEIAALLDDGAPNTGFVLVEINYHYNHVLGLPWFTQFVADPIPFHLYSLWPQVSAEPTSTM